MVYIIAEIGSNHNGNLKLALEMMDEAISTGVNAVKFQTFKADLLLSPDAPKANYQKESEKDNQTQYQMLKNLEFSYEDYLVVKEYGESRGVDVFSTAFDEESLNFLISTNMKIFKIPSGEITNYPFLKKIGALKKKVIISTGMATLEEIHQACNILVDEGTTDITVLHCTTDYPTSLKDVNLNNIITLRKEFPKFSIGFSDHSLGSQASILAASMGITVIEKHFTIDNSLPGPDQHASATTEVMLELVNGVRNVDVLMGSFDIVPTDVELENRVVARKSITARKSIKKGELFTESNLIAKRPGNGISPMEWNNLIGTKASRNYESDSLIDKSELNNNE